MKKFFTLIAFAVVALAASAQTTVSVEGCVYRLGIGDYIKATLTGEKNGEGVMEYSIKEWYGPGSKTLKFTLDSNGYMAIASNVLQYSGSYTYYYTGLADTDISYLSGYKGYDTAGVYDKAKLDNEGKWEGISEIKNDSKFYIYISGYYGPYISNPWGLATDPKGYSYWTFDTDMSDYEKSTAVNAVDAEEAAPAVVKTPNYIIKNGVKYNYAGQRIK